MSSVFGARFFSGRRAAQALAVLLGIMVLGVAMSTVVLDAPDTQRLGPGRRDEGFRAAGGRG
jgi:hypothetical protein